MHYRSSPDCPFRIRANHHEKKGYAKVTTCDDIHTCVSNPGRPASQDIKRAEASKLKFLLEAVPKHIVVDQDTTTKTIIEIVKEKYGQDIALRQAQKVKAMLCPKSKQACTRCGKIHARTVQCDRIRMSQARQPKATVASGLNDIIQIGQEIDGDILQLPDHSTATNDTLGSQVPPQVYISVDSSLLSNPDSRLLHTLHSPQVRAPRDPNLALEAQALPMIPNHFQVQPPAPRTLLMTGMGPRPAAPSAHHQTLKTPRETRHEAARLMQKAARLMQEAARLNAEAARLTASVANE